ncbi:hypothetical protein SLA2020_348240 [Shorea laevis]
MMRGSVQYVKNWLRKERRAHESRPKAHIRKVHTGRVGSSVLDTVSQTYSTGESTRPHPESPAVVVVVVESACGVCTFRVHAIGEGET